MFSEDKKNIFYNFLNPYNYISMYSNGNYITPTPIRYNRAQYVNSPQSNYNKPYNSPIINQSYYNQLNYNQPYNWAYYKQLYYNKPYNAQR